MVDFERRVAETFAEHADTPNKPVFGSGYLITPELVLTAAHTVVKDGVPAPEMVVRLLGDGRQLAGQVVWWRNDETVDAAVVKIVDPRWTPPELPSLRWGRLTGQRGGLRCEVVGFPDALRDARWRDTDHLHGTINPRTRAKAHRHDILLDNAPVDSQDEPSQWGGISGAAVFCGELLLGVVVEDPSIFASRRLIAVPVDEILRDSGFTALIGQTEAESVELADLFDAPTRWNAAPSSAFLLRADAEVVPFRGRSDLLDELTAWCQTLEVISVRLITGPGGQGKTRLAREFAARLRSDRWVTGWLAPPTDGQLQHNHWDRLADTTVPTFVVIDYVETRTEQVSQLITRLGITQRPGLRLRLLLLARSHGDWWRELVGTTPTVERVLAATKVLELPSLERTEASRVAAFRTAVTHFALALPGLGDYADIDWTSVATIVEPPSDLAHPRYGSVLTLHMAALAALLQAGPAPVPATGGEGVEDVLLHHEERYWTKIARARGLDSTRKTLSVAVAVTALVSAVTESDAVALLTKLPGLRDQTEDRQFAIAEWLHDLYPASGRDYWGNLQPDHLAEHLIANITAERPDVFDGLPDSLSLAQAEQLMVVLSRVNVHHPHAADLIIKLVNTKPDPLAYAAVTAAVRAENPTPLINAIHLLAETQVDQPEFLRKLAVLTASVLMFGRWPDKIHHAVVDEYQRLAHDDPVTYRPKLAWALFEQTKYLAKTNRFRSAQNAAEKSIAIWRELDGNDDQRAGIAAALDALATIQLEGNGPQEALPTALKSVDTWEQLVGDGSTPDNDVMGIVQALSNLSAVLNKLGRKKESLDAAQRALEYYQNADDPDPMLANVAASAQVNGANRLIDLGRVEEGLVGHRKAVKIRRRLTESYPNLFEKDLASSLHNLAKLLAQEGQTAEALERIDEAIGIYGYLATLQPDVYTSKLDEVTIYKILIPHAHLIKAQYTARKRELNSKNKKKKGRSNRKRSGKKQHK